MRCPCGRRPLNGFHTTLVSRFAAIRSSGLDGTRSPLPKSNQTVQTSESDTGKLPRALPLISLRLLDGKVVIVLSRSNANKILVTATITV